jgi:hypothetical protein
MRTGFLPLVEMTASVDVFVRLKAEVCTSSGRSFSTWKALH